MQVLPVRWALLPSPPVTLTWIGPLPRTGARGLGLGFGRAAAAAAGLARAGAAAPAGLPFTTTRTV